MRVERVNSCLHSSCSPPGWKIQTPTRSTDSASAQMVAACAATRSSASADSSVTRARRRRASSNPTRRPGRGSVVPMPIVHPLPAFAAL